MERRKGLKELRTLGKISGGVKIAPKIHIHYGEGRENITSRLGGEGHAFSPSMKSWVFSERPFFQRYQSSEKKINHGTPNQKIEIQKIKDPQAQIFKEVGEIRVVMKFPGTVEEEIDIKVFDDILAIEASGKYEGKPVKYHKEILLPFAVEDKVWNSSFENNILEVLLKRRQGKGRGGK
jgi:HSP20 family molecular chaperone IbpA